MTANELITADLARIAEGALPTSWNLETLIRWLVPERFEALSQMPQEQRLVLYVATDALLGAMASVRANLTHLGIESSSRDALEDIATIARQMLENSR